MLNKVQFSTKPLYLQVRDVLLAQILGGKWPPGSSIPNENDLARELSVSIGTMRRALESLETEHIIWRQQGRGTFVADQNDSKYARRFTCLRNQLGEPIDDNVDVLERAVNTAGDHELHQLKLDPGAKILRMTRVRSMRGKPFLLEFVSLPQSRFPGLADVKTLPAQIATLAQQYGFIVSSAEEEVSVVVASDKTGLQLGIAPGTPLLKLDRTVYATDGIPIEWRSGFCHLDKLRYCVSLG